MLTRQDALCHGDYTPKNMLVHPSLPSPFGRGAGGEGFTLVDYETAHFGDPTMDLGLFLAHLTLKAIRNAHHQHSFVSLMRAFWNGYCKAARFSSRGDMERRGMRHLGVCLLARVDGTSPVDYLGDDAKRDLVRRLGRAILLHGVNRWDDAWSLLDSMR